MDPVIEQDKVEVDEVSRIRSLLAVHQSGINIKAIARVLGLNRNTVARHLQTLLLLGEAEMRQAGISHIYLSSCRVPYSAIQAIITDPFLLISPDGTVLGMNAAFLDLASCTLESVVGKRVHTAPFSTLITRETTKCIRAALEPGSEREPFQFLTKSDRRAFYSRIVQVVLHDGAPATCFILKSTIEGDVLLPLQGPHGRISHSSIDQREMYLTLAPDLKVVGTSGAFTRMYQKTARTMVGRPFYDLATGEDTARVGDIVRTISSSEPVREVTFPVIISDRPARWERWAVRGIFSRGEGLTGYTATGIDITAEHDLTDRLTAYQEGMDELIRRRTDDLREVNRQLYDEVEHLESQRQQLQFLQFAIDSTGDPHIWIDEEGKVIHTNENVVRVLAYTPDEALGISIKEVLPDIPLQTITGVSARIEDKGSLLAGTSMRTKDGRMIPAEVSISRIRYQGKEHFSIILRDITLWKAVEESRKKLIAIIEANPSMVAIWNPSRKLIYLNRAGRNLLGIDSSADISSLSITDFFTPSDRAEFLQTGIPQAITQGVWRHESRLNARGGKTIPVEVILIAHSSGGKTVSEFSTLALDITDRKAAEQRIMENERKYRALVEASIDGIMLVSLDGTIHEANMAATRMFHYERDSLTGRPVETILTLDEGGSVVRSLTGGGMEEGIYIGIEGRRRDGTTFPAEVSGTTVTLDGVKKVIVHVNDITDRRRAELTLQTAAFYARSLVEDTTAPLLMLNPDGIVSDLNRAAEEFVGVKRDSLKGRNLATVTESSVETTTLLAEVNAQGVVRDRVIRFRLPRGGFHEGTLTATAVRDTTGVINGIVLILKPQNR